MNKTLVFIILLMIVILGIFSYIWLNSNNAPRIPSVDINVPSTPKGNNENNNAASNEQIISISASGFLPQKISVAKGTRVTFVNEDIAPHWPASAAHPTHTIYPGSSIEKCGSGENIFDACKPLQQSESFSFIFNEVGEWRYHDHLNTKFSGVVSVE